jgi:hypothetical protein
MLASIFFKAESSSFEGEGESAFFCSAALGDGSWDFCGIVKSSECAAGTDSSVSMGKAEALLQDICEVKRAIAQMRQMERKTITSYSRKPLEFL